MRIQQNWRNADIFRRIPKDLTQATTTGAIVSIVCVVVMTLLFLGEVISYIWPRMHSDMLVAPDEEDGEKLRVFLDMTFPVLPCTIISVDIIDILHNHALNSMANIVKTPLTLEGKQINDGRDPSTFVSATEGCHIKGFIEVAKVPGNFHVSAHTTQSLIAKHMPEGIDVKHVIHHLSFAPQQTKTQPRSLLNPLDNTKNIDASHQTYTYFLDVVPVVFQGSFYNSRAYQYTSRMSTLRTPSRQLAAVYFQYQLSPITVRYSSARVSFTHFLTYVCAIVGGVYTVAGLLSRFIYASTKEFQKRVLGKGD